MPQKSKSVAFLLLAAMSLFACGTGPQANKISTRAPYPTFTPRPTSTVAPISFPTPQILELNPAAKSELSACKIAGSGWVKIDPENQVLLVAKDPDTNSTIVGVVWPRHLKLTLFEPATSARQELRLRPGNNFPTDPYHQIEISGEIFLCREKVFVRGGKIVPFNLALPEPRDHSE